jgi:hypothetical protein
MTDTEMQDVVLVSRYIVPPTSQVVLRVLDHDLALIDYYFDLYSELFFFIPDAYPDPVYVNPGPTDPGSDDEFWSRCRVVTS